MSRNTTAISSAMARNMNTTTLIGMSRREPHQAEEVVTSKEPKKPVGERKGKGRKPKPGKSSGKEPKRAKKTKKSRVGKSMERHGDAHQHDRRCTTKCTPKPKPVVSQPSCSSPGSPCTVLNFATVCCQDKDGTIGCFFPIGDPRKGNCQ